MSANSKPSYLGAFMVRPFPEPGRALRHCYRELHIAANGTAEQRKALGDLRMLPRPWDPSSIREPQLRRELWTWLDLVVSWLNAEYVWDVVGIIPPCWPRHPHLVHEIAVLADQRRSAGLGFNSDALEEWHRYALPAFTERGRTRLKDHCEEGHSDWPARARYSRHGADPAVQQRDTVFAHDEALMKPRGRDASESLRLHLIDTGNLNPDVVDLETGEILDCGNE
ncbi:hypothetical protein [Terrabacter sp. Ter38]|uniref:hypothetical protein n=1 Tax=Terrabacter sp. Ter38 TaxID=2926030 RepID=UPI00211871FA|nr:hypothetical protein [Terrabacter sp. Ter38]